MKLNFDFRKWIIRTSLILVPLLVISGTVFLLNWLGVVKVSKIAAKIPVVNKWVYEDKTSIKKAAKPKPNPLLEENKKLQGKLASLDGELGELKNKINETTSKSQKEKEALELKKKQLEEEIQNLKDTAQAQEEDKETKAIREASYEKLAQYYANMKPKNAVAFMEKLDDQVIIGVLDKLEDEQAAKILSAMEPDRAAKIVKLMSN